MTALSRPWKGTTGIDGIYTDGKGNYLIVESKTTRGIKPGDPDGCVGKLCTVSGGERQMSNKWIIDRIDADTSLSDTQKKAIKAGLSNGKTTRLYSKTDGEGNTKFNVINTAPGDRNNPPTTAVIGKTWTP